MSIGSRIKEARLKIKLTQEELAYNIGATKGAIANYENEVSTPKVDLLFKLFEALQCDANYLYQDDMPNVVNHTAVKIQNHNMPIEVLESYNNLTMEMQNHINEIIIALSNKNLEKSKIPSDNEVEAFLESRRKKSLEFAAYGNSGKLIDTDLIEKGLKKYKEIIDKNDNTSR